MRVTKYSGGIETHRWTWSDFAYLFMISIPLMQALCSVVSTRNLLHWVVGTLIVGDFLFPLPITGKAIIRTTGMPVDYPPIWPSPFGTASANPTWPHPQGTDFQNELNRQELFWGETIGRASATMAYFISLESLTYLTIQCFRHSTKITYDTPLWHGFRDTAMFQRSYNTSTRVERG